MNKKQDGPDEMRLSAEKFDEMMRRALGVPAPAEPKAKEKPKRPAQKAPKPSNN